MVSKDSWLENEGWLTLNGVVNIQSIRSTTYLCIVSTTIHIAVGAKWDLRWDGVATETFNTVLNSRVGKALAESSAKLHSHTRLREGSSRECTSTIHVIGYTGTIGDRC